MIIECGQCEARGRACGSCAVAALVGQPGQPGGPRQERELDPAEIRALTVLANAGMIPPLRYARRMARAS